MNPNPRLIPANQSYFSQMVDTIWRGSRAAPRHPQRETRNMASAVRQLPQDQVENTNGSRLVERVIAVSALG